MNRKSRIRVAAHWAAAGVAVAVAAYGTYVGVTWLREDCVDAACRADWRERIGLPDRDARHCNRPCGPVEVPTVLGVLVSGNHRDPLGATRASKERGGAGRRPLKRYGVERCSEPPAEPIVERAAIGPVDNSELIRSHVDPSPGVQKEIAHFVMRRASFELGWLRLCESEFRRRWLRVVGCHESRRGRLDRSQEGRHRLHRGG
jgi:hypothetical protein